MGLLNGEPGDSAILDRQVAYPELFREQVAEHADGQDRLSDAAKGELHREMTEHLPGAPLEALVTLNADPVAAELATECSS